MQHAWAVIGVILFVTSCSCVVCGLCVFHDVCLFVYCCVVVVVCLMGALFHLLLTCLLALIFIQE